MPKSHLYFTTSIHFLQEKREASEFGDPSYRGGSRDGEIAPIEDTDVNEGSELQTSPMSAVVMYYVRIILLFCFFTETVNIDFREPTYRLTRGNPP